MENSILSAFKAKLKTLEAIKINRKNFYNRATKEINQEIIKASSLGKYEVVSEIYGFNTPLTHQDQSELADSILKSLVRLGYKASLTTRIYHSPTAGDILVMVFNLNWKDVTKAKKLQ